MKILHRKSDDHYKSLPYPDKIQESPSPCNEKLDIINNNSSYSIVQSS